jgi:hypothetical protein
MTEDRVQLDEESAVVLLRPLHDESIWTMVTVGALDLKSALSRHGCCQILTLRLL